MNTWRHSYRLIIAILITSSAFASYAADDAVSIANQHAKIIQAFDEGVAQLRATHASPEQIRHLITQRDAELSALIQRADRISFSELAPTDLAAVASSCEYLRFRETSIKYATEAIRRDPTVQGAYAPLVRSLLNFKKVSDAVNVLALARQHLERDSAVHALHYFVYHRSRIDGNATIACDHLDFYVDWLCERAPHDPACAEALAHHIAEVSSAYNADGRGRFRLDRLGGLRAVVVKAIASKVALGASGQSAGDAQIISRLYHALCELQSVCAPAQRQDTPIEWCRFAIQADKEQRTSESLAEVARAFSYLYDNIEASSDLDECDRLARDALSDRFADQKIVKTHRMAPAALIKMVKQEKASRQLVGSRLASLDKVTPILNNSDDANDAPHSCVLLCIWSPLAGLQDVLALSRFEERHQSVKVRCISPSFGFTIDPMTGRATQSLENGVDVEQRHLSEYLARSDVRTACASMASDSPLWLQLHVTCFPQFVLVDKKGVIRAVINGRGPKKFERLESALEQLRHQQTGYEVDER